MIGRKVVLSLMICLQQGQVYAADCAQAPDVPKRSVLGARAGVVALGHAVVEHHVDGGGQVHAAGGGDVHDGM